ncbi:hypothetical protein PY32053_04140 (plasmid) [Paracoccus yeei]|uniref:Uncharacterized protein n=1 Tax=Paracoccus yeei TaxID=147645 RepID=A0A386UTI6_9RHOB|nr:hypothetical protein [Paracoccus yeei]AYF03678.1 hypothetical protein PY32053_04140 [Paracoccus yeei]
MAERGCSSAGLARMLLRRPDLRPYFRSLQITHSVLLTLCEAYEEATRALETLPPDGPEHREYVEICQALEDEFERVCRQVHGGTTSGWH